VCRHFQERIGNLLDVLAGDDRPHAIHAECRGRIDLHDVGVRMRRADDVGVQRAGRDGKIVGIAAASRQQRRIFLTQDTRAETL